MHVQEVRLCGVERRKKTVSRRHLLPTRIISFVRMWSFVCQRLRARKSRKNSIVPIGKHRWCQELIFRMGTFGDTGRMQFYAINDSAGTRKRVTLALRPCEHISSQTSISGFHLRWAARSFVPSLKFSRHRRNKESSLKVSTKIEVNTKLKTGEETFFMFVDSI